MPGLFRYSFSTKTFTKVGLQSNNSDPILVATTSPRWPKWFILWDWMQDRVSGRRIKLQSRLWNTSTLFTQTGKLFTNKSDYNQLVSTNGVHIQDIRKKWCQCSSREGRVLFKVCNITSHHVRVRYSDHVDSIALYVLVIFLFNNSFLLHD